MKQKRIKNNKTIHFIMTGGTIDSHYDGTKDTVVPNDHSILPGFISGLKLHIPATFTEICMKDSRDMTLRDMKKIKETIEKSKNKYFIVTHGTYTMPDTARYLQVNLKRKDMVVLFTAAMVPQAFAFADAPFNIGYSMAKVFHLDPGVYVCMNGRIFDPAEIAKLIGQGRFVSIFSTRK